MNVTRNRFSPAGLGTGDELEIVMIVLQMTRTSSIIRGVPEFLTLCHNLRFAARAHSTLFLFFCFFLFFGSRLFSVGAWPYSR